MRPDTLERLTAARRERRPAVLLTWLATGEQRLLDGEHGWQALPEVLGDAARRARREDRSAVVETDAGRVFVHVFNPPLGMLVVGAVHIAQALAPMATLAGFEVTVIDPRRAFATEARFPGVRIDHRWPDEALEELNPGARSAVVTLTHDPKLDDPALQVALNSEVFYIGSLGSRRTHAARLERLARAGFDAERCRRIHGPAGLDIGARLPEEIAVSILAEAVAVLRKGEPG